MNYFAITRPGSMAVKNMKLLTDFTSHTNMAGSTVFWYSYVILSHDSHYLRRNKSKSK